MYARTFSKVDPLGWFTGTRTWGSEENNSVQTLTLYAVCMLMWGILGGIKEPNHLIHLFELYHSTTTFELNLTGFVNI